jgi:4-amino-4-deoxy-L-arabinose transferase-like glycosyltransferase
MADPTPQARMFERVAVLTLIIEIALALRVVAADLVEWYARSKKTLCIFPDTDIYWYLARMIRAGEPFEVTYWGNLPHFALRTPGYPLFLAGCQALFGERTLVVRLAQAMLGALTVWLVYKLTARLTGATSWVIALSAAVLAAIDPYSVVTSALILSEAVFIPLMLASLWGLAVIWPSGKEAPTKRWRLPAIGAGLAFGAAVLVRPSWTLFVPATLLAWLVVSASGKRLIAFKGTVVILLAASAVMAPWWIRNARVFGRFVPTALWMGASLYDGLNPHATGASDMDFMNDPEFWPLGELEQDALLRDRALEFVRERPGQALRLAVVKLGRYWSPWPNADTLRSKWLAAASAIYTLPLFALWITGAWALRRDPRALVLLGGPLLYFCVLHTVFAGSMRYRIPGAVPAAGLAAIGFGSLVNWRSRRNTTTIN